MPKYNSLMGGLFVARSSPVLMENSMNLCVSDDKVILNIQGIRNVSWGEMNITYVNNPGRPYFMKVTYKNNSELFYYRTELEARTIFDKVRVAMDKSFKP